MNKNLILMFLLIANSASFLTARGDEEETGTTNSAIQTTLAQPTKNPGLFKATANSFAEYAKVKTGSIVNTTKERITKLKDNVAARAQSSWERFKNLFRAQSDQE